MAYSPNRVEWVEDKYNSLKRFDKFEAWQQTISSSASQITPPRKARRIWLKNTNATTIFIGGDSSITYDGSTVYPLSQNEEIEIFIKNASNFKLWAVANGSITLYGLGAWKR